MQNEQEKLKQLIKKKYSYPNEADSDFQERIYKKREYQFHRMPPRNESDDYEKVKEYRANICARKFIFLEHQFFLGNFINPNTPFTGLLIFHGTGTGKTGAAISITEQFKPMVQKYNTKIYILVPGPVIKEMWKDALLQYTGETYYKTPSAETLNEIEKTKLKKIALNNALQYYRIITHRSFYRKVLGEKIIEKEGTKGKKKVYRKTEEGEIARDISTDRLYNLNNTVLVVDEAHNVTGNEYGESLKKIKKESTNLRILLLTATPMKNLGDDIVELLNYIRPIHSPIVRDNIFTSQRGHDMQIKEGGKEYLRKMANGYVSYLRGADPLIFAKRVDIGEVPPGLLFTKVIRCKMLPFQLETYQKEAQRKKIEITKEGVEIKMRGDTLEKRSESVSNFVLPGLSSDKKTIVGYFGKDGLNTIREQLKSDSELLNRKIENKIISLEKTKKMKNVVGDYLKMNPEGKNISGEILSLPYLKHFSIKFHEALKNLEELVYGKKGLGTAFVYSYLVKVGIELFKEILLQNGYLEYIDQSVALVPNQNTKCYFCGLSYKDHLTNKIPSQIPKHTYHPTTFIIITGKTGEEGVDIIPEEKQKILNQVFNHVDNKDGKFIKFILGSRVINEGVSMQNIKEIHILDVHFNLGRVDQVAGRGIRQCSHYKIISDEYKYPQVDIYKYVVSLDGELSTEEILYKNAELKHLIIKMIERILKEIAIDCPLNYSNNVFKNDLQEFKDCNQEGKQPCPALCDYMDCAYQCFSKNLNNEYYDPERLIYRAIPKDQLDYSTFTQSLAKNEIEFSKTRIKELFRIKHFYLLKEITKYVKEKYDVEKRELFDDFFVFKALDEMIPLTENDFNNFHDTVIDKFGNQGYLIYRNNYYLFQPFNQNEDVPIYYRTTFDKNLHQDLNLRSYMKEVPEVEQQQKTEDLLKETVKSVYNFDSVRDYYDNRPEFDYVGIVDKELSRRKHKSQEELEDVFKIRNKRGKILIKKRGTGIPSAKGAVCTTKDVKILKVIAQKLKIKGLEFLPETRIDLCHEIKKKLLELEKYSTNGMTYMIIPANHPKYPFPYNLVDRVKYVKNKLNEKFKKINLKSTTGKDKKSYLLTVKDNKEISQHKTFMESLKATKSKDYWIIKID